MLLRFIKLYKLYTRLVLVHYRCKERCCDITKIQVLPTKAFWCYTGANGSDVCEKCSAGTYSSYSGKRLISAGDWWVRRKCRSTSAFTDIFNPNKSVIYSLYCLKQTSKGKSFWIWYYCEHACEAWPSLPGGISSGSCSLCKLGTYSNVSGVDLEFSFDLKYLATIYLHICIQIPWDIVCFIQKS